MCTVQVHKRQFHTVRYKSRNLEFRNKIIENKIEIQKLRAKWWQITSYLLLHFFLLFHCNKASWAIFSNISKWIAIDRVLCIFISISLAFAIRCWQCSNLQGNCGDPFRDEYVSPASFVDCSLRSGGGPFDSQWSQRLPYGQYNQQQWRQPWAQAQPQPLAQAQIWGYGPSNRQYGNQPVCVKAKSISK